ncbi:hypothetical protein DITRI_Ditri04bG0056200 [Diplodiscus trichospermus]
MNIPVVIDEPLLVTGPSQVGGELNGDGAFVAVSDITSCIANTEIDDARVGCGQYQEFLVRMPIVPYGMMDGTKKKSRSEVKDKEKMTEPAQRPQRHKRNIKVSIKGIGLYTNLKTGQ